MSEPHWKKTKSLSGTAEDRGFDTRSGKRKTTPHSLATSRSGKKKKVASPRNERWPARTKWRSE